MFDLLPSVVLNTILLCRFPFADSPLQILLCRFPVAKPPCSSPNCYRICPCADLPLRVCQQICLSQTPSHRCGLANLQSTGVQFSLQDYCLAALQSTLMPIIIAWLRLQSIFGPRSSHDLPLSLWRVTFGQPAITRSAPDQSAFCSFPFPSSSCTLSFVLSCWALLFALEVVVTGDQLTSLEAAPFTIPISAYPMSQLGYLEKLS